MMILRRFAKYIFGAHGSLHGQPQKVLEEKIMNEGITAPLPKNIIIIRCFDDRIDVPLHAMYKELKSDGCKKVREEKLAGGGLIYAKHFDFANEQIETFIDRGFNSIILVPHTGCHHVRLHKLIPADSSEEEFLEKEMERGLQNIRNNFPNLLSYAYVIDTEKSKNGIQSVKRCLCSHETELFNPFNCIPFSA